MDVRAGRITIDEAEAELDRLEQRATVSWLNIDGNDVAAQMSAGGESAESAEGGGGDANEGPGSGGGGGGGGDGSTGGNANANAGEGLDGVDGVEAVAPASLAREDQGGEVGAGAEVGLSAAAAAATDDAAAGTVHGNEAGGAGNDGGIRESQLLGNSAGAYEMLEPEPHGAAGGPGSGPAVMRDVEEVPAAAPAGDVPATTFLAALQQLVPPDSDSDDELPSDPELPPDPEDGAL